MAGTVVVTNVGLGITTALLAASPNKYIGWGTDNDPVAAAGDTSLNAESANETRATGTASQQTTTTADDTFRVVGTLTCATSAKAITEAGIFSQEASGGSMFVRATFDAINVSVGDSIQFTFNTVFDQG